ncbi:MAG: hypothetical protein BZ151_11245, partial [Desulfobacca sp. 4484_104]
MRKSYLLALAITILLSLLTVPKSWTAEIAVATDPGSESKPTVACDQDNHEYMVVWEQPFNDDEDDIYAKDVSSTGVVHSTRYFVARHSSSESSHDSIFNRDEQEYVVVWDDNSSSSHYIRLGRYKGAGSSVDEDSMYSTEPVHRPHVAYNPSRDEYFVLFEREVSPGSNEIRAQRFSLSGSQAGSQILISNASPDERRPAVSCNPAKNLYLVVWQEETDHSGTYSYDIRGLMVNGNGSFHGSEFSIASSEYDLTTPQVTYNAKAKQFLVVWEDHGMGDRQNIDAAILDAGDGSIVRSMYAIHDDGFDYAPAVSYNEWLDQYLVVFEHRDSPTGESQIWGQPLDADGSCFNGIDNETVISAAAGSQSGPAIARQSLASFFTVWTDDRNGMDNSDIFGEFDNGPDDYEEQDGTPPPPFFPINTPIPRSFQDSGDEDWFHFLLDEPNTEYTVYLKSTYPNYLKPGDFHVSVWFYANGTYSAIDMYSKPQTGSDNLWFKTTSGSGTYRVLVTSSSTYTGPASTYSLAVYKNPQVNGIDQTLQKLGTTRTNTIFGEYFSEDTTVSMFLDGGNERDILTTLELPTEGTAVTVAGNRLWLNSSENGLEYYSLNDPQAPVKEGEVDLGDKALTLASHGNFLYTTVWNDSTYVMEKIDALSAAISDTVEDTLDSKPLFMKTGPDHLCILTQNRIITYNPDDLSSFHSYAHDCSSYTLKSLAVNNSYIFVVYPTGIHVFNSSGSQFPDIDLSQYNSLQDMAFIGDHTALVATSNSIITLDLSQYPDSGPDILAEVFLDTMPEVLQVQNNRCYVAGRNALEILDISDPAHPQKIGYTSTPRTEAQVLLDNLAYLTHYNSENEFSTLSVVDTATPSLYQAVGKAKLSPPFRDTNVLWASNIVHQVTHYNNHLYVVIPGEENSDQDVIDVIDISDPAHPVQDETINININTFNDISSSPSGYLALSCGSSGIYIHFIGGAAESYWHGAGLSNVRNTMVDPDNGNSLWVADDNGLTQLNVTRSGATTVKTFSNYLLNIYQIYQILKITENYIYVLGSAWGSTTGIAKVDKSTGQSVGHYDVETISIAAITNDNKAITCKITSGPWRVDLVSFSIYDISGDDHILLNELEFSFPYISNVYIHDNRIYLSSLDGLTTIDISDAAHPEVLGTQKFPSTTGQLQEINNLIYAFGNFGLVASPLPQKIDTTYVSPTELNVTIPSPVLDGNYTLRVHNGPISSDLPGAITFTDVDRLLTSRAIIVAGSKSSDLTNDLVWIETKAYADQA